MNTFLDNLAAHGIELTHLLLFSIFLMLVFVVWLLIQIKEYLYSIDLRSQSMLYKLESGNDSLHRLERGLGEVNRQLSHIQSQGIPPKYPNYIDS